MCKAVYVQHHMTHRKHVKIRPRPVLAGSSLRAPALDWGLLHGLCRSLDTCLGGCGAGGGWLGPRLLLHALLLLHVLLLYLLLHVLLHVLLLHWLLHWLLRWLRGSRGLLGKGRPGSGTIPSSNSRLLLLVLLLVLLQLLLGTLCIGQHRVVHLNGIMQTQAYQGDAELLPDRFRKPLLYLPQHLLPLLPRQL